MLHLEIRWQEEIAAADWSQGDNLHDDIINIPSQSTWRGH